MEELVLKFGGFYILFATVLLLLFRKYLYSIFDPAIFIILIMASCLCLSIDSSFFYYILFACLAFLLGVASCGKITRNFKNPVKRDNFMLLEFFTLGVLALYLFANLILYKDTGIPLFSGNATENKIAIFGAGTGWIRRIFFFSSIIPIGLILLSILSKSKSKRLFYVGCLVLFMFVSVLLGSKSGFLGVFYILWLFYTQENLWDDSNMELRYFIKGKIKYLLIGSLFLFFFIVFNESRENPDKLLFSLGFRLMEFGDVMLYYKLPLVRQFFEPYNFIDYINVELNGIFGLLRLTSYKEPLGYLMYRAYSGSTISSVITGPNTVFLVRGHIFFGYIGGIIYCYIIGYLFAYLRRKILNMDINNVFVYALSIFIFFNLEGFLREFNQYLSVIFDFVVYSSLIFFTSLLVNDFIIKQRKKNV